MEKRRAIISFVTCLLCFAAFAQSEVSIQVKDKRYVKEHQIEINKFVSDLETKLLEAGHNINRSINTPHVNQLIININFLNYYQSSAKTLFGKGIIEVELVCPTNLELNEEFPVSVDIPFEENKLKNLEKIEFRGDVEKMSNEVTLLLAERTINKLGKNLALAQQAAQNHQATASPNNSNQTSSAPQTKIDSSIFELDERLDYALIFAIDHYDNWGDLVNPVNDAKTIEKELKESYGFKTELIIDANKDEILSKLRQYAGMKYHPDNQLFIFFAGHGVFDEVFGEGYIVCKNSETNDDIKTSYISHSNLRTIINNIPCNHILLSMDVCFGGTFDPTIANNTERGTDAIYKGVSQQEFIQRKLKFTTRRFLTSGGKEYVPDGRPGQHSPFARKLIEALRNYGGQDRILTIGEILTYIERVSPQPRYGEFGKNQPGSDFIFIAR